MDINDYLSALPADAHQLIIDLVGNRFQKINAPNFYLNMQRLRMISRHHRLMIDDFLSKPEIAFHLISHLRPHRVMRFIRYYRETSAFKKLEHDYETFKTPVLDERPEKLMNIIAYALATNDIYKVPWDLFTRHYNDESTTLLESMDDISKGCIANLIVVSRFIFHTLMDKDFNAVQAALNSLMHNQQKMIYFVNFAKANFVIEMHNFRDGPSIFISAAGLTLAGANFEGANLQFVNFRCDLSSVNFERAIMNTARLSGRKIINTNFNRAILKGVRFNEPDRENTPTLIDHCNFAHADLERTVFYADDIHDSNFTEANLSQSNVTGVEFRNCEFKDANLKSVIFFDAPAMTFTNVAPTVIVHHNIDNNSEENYEVLLRASASNFRDVLASWHAQQPRGPAEAVLASVMREEMYAHDETSLAILRSAVPVPAVPELTITIAPEPHAKRQNNKR